MIIQGSNNPITLTFDSDLSEIPTIVATLWLGKGNNEEINYGTECNHQWRNI